MPWTFYTVFLGTIGSIVAHGYLAISKHNHENPKTLSELAAAERHLLIRFRWTVLGFSTLLGITVYWFIAPRNQYGLVQSLAWSLEYLGGFLMAVVPARDKLFSLHNMFAQAMAIGMLALAYLFLPALHGYYFLLGLVLTLVMTLFGIATVLDKRHYIVHEMSFIFISHITICTAALGLR
jgi:hypothetical protein